jgi:hypothetical protein
MPLRGVPLDQQTPSYISLLGGAGGGVSRPASCPSGGTVAALKHTFSSRLEPRWFSILPKILEPLR